jgi:hypothetical protein
LAAALRGPDPHLPIKVRTSSPYLRKLTALLAAQALPDDAASTDLDLWAQLLTAAKGRTIEIAAAKPEPRTPLAFVAAWAELARDKAKATGAFTASIPKTNLAKVQGL